MERSEFIEWMDSNFERVGTSVSNEWQNEFYSIELMGRNDFVFIWNRKNGRYVHYKPISLEDAVEWIGKNKDIRPIVPEKYRIENEYR